MMLLSFIIGLLPRKNTIDESCGLMKHTVLNRDKHWLISVNVLTDFKLKLSVLITLETTVLAPEPTISWTRLVLLHLSFSFLKTNRPVSCSMWAVPEMFATPFQHFYWQCCSHAPSECPAGFSSINDRSNLAGKQFWVKPQLEHI